MAVAVVEATPFFDDLWSEHGPAIRAAQLAAIEAEAQTVDVLGEVDPT
jgi:hypothetical protein